MTTEERLAKLERELSATKRRNRWVMWGGSILILGFLLGVLVMFAARKSQQPSLRDLIQSSQPESFDDIKYKKAGWTIRNIKIECIGDIITPKHIMEYAQLTNVKDKYMSAEQIEEKRNYLLTTVPRIKAVEIKRRLPDELIILVQERVSIARLKMNDYYLTVDRDGYVLGAASDTSNLPVISGHNIPGMRPGTCLAQTIVMNALEVLDICKTTPIGQRVRIASIDVSNIQSLELWLEKGERVQLAWDHMGESSSLAREDLEKKLVQLADSLK